jgi:hypothetical protein
VCIRSSVAEVGSAGNWSVQLDRLGPRANRGLPPHWAAGGPALAHQVPSSLSGEGTRCGPIRALIYGFYANSMRDYLSTFLLLHRWQVLAASYLHLRLIVLCQGNAAVAACFKLPLWAKILQKTSID